MVEERQLEQFANRGYDVLDKIRALDPSVNLVHLHRHWARGQDPARSPGYGRAGAGYGAGRGGDQAAEMTLDGLPSMAA